MNYNNKYTDEARRIFLNDYKKIIEKHGPLSPSINKSPIYPPMSCIEYDSMENDTAKYFLYYSAIFCALEQLKMKKKFEILENKQFKVMHYEDGNFSQKVVSPTNEIPSKKLESGSIENGEMKIKEFICENNLATRPEKLPPKSEIPSKKLKLDSDQNLSLGNLDKSSLESLEIMVVGAGRGRLVEYCYDGLTRLNLKGKVHVIEANLFAFNHLKEKFSDFENIIVYEPIAIRTIEEVKYGLNNGCCDGRLVDLAARKPITVFVSELLGSFGDNEFCSEILETCVEMFGKSNCISIPESNTTYVCAINSQTLNNYFKDSENVESLQLLGLPEDTIVLSDLVELYTNSCTKSSVRISGKCNLNHGKDADLTGIAGYFVLKLYGDIFIDTRPCETRNTFFWETAFFPVDNTAKTLWKKGSAGCTFTLLRNLETIRRNFDNSDDHIIFDISSHVLRMWYVWSILTRKNEQLFESKIHNKNGTVHSLYL